MKTTKDIYLEKKIDDIDSWVAAVAGAYHMNGEQGFSYQVKTHRDIAKEIAKIVKQVYQHGFREGEKSSPT